MKTIKPQRLAVLTKIYEYQSKFFLSISASVFFDFNQPRQLLTEVDMWTFLAKEVGKNTMLDMGMPKQRGEFLVYGKCHALKGIPVNAATVRVKVGMQQKTLNVFGDRHWERHLGVTTMSVPAPFTEIDLTYANAFGGADYPDNPLGRGMLQQDQPHRLPNIELPGSPVLSPDDRPAPAGFGAINFGWPQRISKAGTYDDKWLRTRFPGYADDIGWSIFNAAPEDQWLPGFFKGDEKVEVAGMHPQQEVQHVTLPECMAACFITQRTTEGDQFREIEMQPETLMLFPSAGRGILMFRGVIEIATDDGADVIHLVAGAEKLGVPKKMEHYQEILAIRLDKKKGALHALDDTPLLPPYMATPLTKREPEKNPPEKTEIPTVPSAVVSALDPGASDLIMAQAKTVLQAQHTRLLELATQYAFPVSVIEGINQAFSADFSLDKLNPNNVDVKAEMLKQQAAAEQRLREICAQHKMDFDALVKSAISLPDEAPEPMADTIMQQLNSVQSKLKALGKLNTDLDQLIAESPASLAEQDTKNLAQYQKAVQQHALTSMPEASKVSIAVKEASTFVRGGSYVGRDLTGVDFSGLDLREVDFTNAILEKTNFNRALLGGAVFANAALAYAKFDGANLAKANFNRARLSFAQFGNAIAHETNFAKAALNDADFGTADFSRANLNQCNLLNAKLGNANFSGVNAQQAKFIHSDQKNSDAETSSPMHGIRLSGADLTKAVFLKCKMDQADFSEACLEKTSFISAGGDKINFSKARLNKSSIVKNSVLTGANFAGAVLKGTNLRGADLTGAQFEAACLDGADLSGCNLQSADLKQVQATGARFINAELKGADLSGANLHQAVLRKAKLAGAKLVATNLYQADMLRVQVDATTIFDKANLKKTMMKAEKK